MRRQLSRVIAGAIVIGAAVAAYAIGNGDIRATPEVTIITITSTTGTGTGGTTLQNTTTATTYSTLVGSDASCDPMLMFSLAGGNPAPIAPQTNRLVNVTCPPRGSAAMRRCLYHATNNTTGTALADFMTVCLYGSSPTLAPQPTSLDFGPVVVGESAMLQLDLQHAGAAGQTISRVYLQTSDLDGNFQFSTPCNPDAPFCDEDILAVSQGDTLPVQIRCTPQTAGMHTAQIYVGTNTFQLLAQPVTVTCMGTAATAPVLGVNPTSLDLPAPIEVLSGSANVVVHLTNAGSGTLLINDVRTVDVDSGASIDWTYTATGECSGLITSSCSLDGGEQVDLVITFDPSRIGRRRATLLVSYKDTIDRTKEIPLDASGLGATLGAAGGVSTLAFGSVPIGRQSTIDFELDNHGNRDITAQLALATGTTPPFTVSPATSAVVAPSVPRTISLTCAPTSTGDFTTTVTAQAMDALIGSPVSLSATCKGSPLALHANPTALNLGEIRKGGGVVNHTVQLLSATAPTQVTLAGQPLLESANSSITLAPFSQATTPSSFEISIDPAELPEGQLSINVLVTDSNNDTLAIPVLAKIVVASYEVSGSVDLGTFCVGQPTTSSNVSLASDGTATIRLTQPTLDKSPSPFQLANTSPSVYPSTLAAGTTATVSITPQRQLAVTQLDDTLTWHTDVENEQNAITSITARFIDRGAAIAPPAIDFGEVTIHLYSEDGQRVIIQNCNATPLQLDQPVIKTPFSIDSPTFPPMLNPNETATFSVGFHPTRIGVITDTLRITSPQLPGAPLLVTLVGEGTAPEEPTPDAGGSNGKDNTSFYACNCKSTHPSGVIPILIAVMCVLFPRRSASFTRRRRASVRLP
ncbi:MAG TPA: choice-of-anchor D domain-containing protein [Kofleriaceae bacterium]